MFEVSFKMQHDCPYTRFTMKNPEVRVVQWCNNHIHVMEVDCPNIETFTRIEPDLKELLLWKGGRVLKKNFLEGNLQLIVKTCRCDKIVPNVSNIIEENSCLQMQPETYYGGWEEYRVIGFRENDYKRMFEELSRLGPLEIVQKKVVPEKSIREAFVISVNSIFSELTAKQVNSLMAALEYGYYQVPKKMTAEEIANKNKVPRTTFEEHLRKAESKILRAMAPYVRMYASKPQRAVEKPPEIPVD
jgi:predicted DNA binding protein